jgi:ABC-type branched-subunit amino acid transport system ATPase component
MREGRGPWQALFGEQAYEPPIGLAHKSYVLEMGRVALQGKSEDLLRGEPVKKAYVGP